MKQLHKVVVGGDVIGVELKRKGKGWVQKRGNNN